MDSGPWELCGRSPSTRAGQSMTSSGKMKDVAARAGGARGRTPRRGLWMARDEARGHWLGRFGPECAEHRQDVFVSFLKFYE